MQWPEEITGHDVDGDARAASENRDPENPTVVHSAPARRARMISVVVVTMLWIVHTNQRWRTTLPAVLEKKKTGRYQKSEILVVKDYRKVRA